MLQLAGAMLPAWGLDLSGSLGLDLDSNIGNAGSSHNTRSDTILQFGGAAAWQAGLGSRTAWQLRGSVDGEGFASNSELSEARAAVRLRVLHRVGSGFLSPTLAAWISGGMRESGSDLRGGGDYRAGFYALQQLTTKLGSRVGYQWHKRDSESRVFDLSGGTATVGFDLIASPGLTLYAELDHYRGDIVSSIADPVMLKSEHAYLEGLSEATEVDEAYGDNWFALKLRATGTAATMGFNMALGENWALDSRLRVGGTHVDRAPKDYYRGQIGVVLLRRF